VACHAYALAAMMTRTLHWVPHRISQDEGHDRKFGQTDGEI